METFYWLVVVGKVFIADNLLRSVSLAKVLQELFLLVVEVGKNLDFAITPANYPYLLGFSQLQAALYDEVGDLILI